MLNSDVQPAVPARREASEIAMNADDRPSSASAGASDFIERLTGAQSRMFAYINSLTADIEMAKDILQETNRVLWRGASKYDPDRPFLPWAFTHAFNQVRAARSRRERDRLVFHDDETLRVISNDAAQSLLTPVGDHLVALEQCVEKLAPDQRDTVERFYHLGHSLEEIATAMTRRANTIAVMLHRVRLTLAKCIRETLAEFASNP